MKKWSNWILRHNRVTYHDLHSRNDPKPIAFLWLMPPWRPTMASAKGSAHFLGLLIVFGFMQHILWHGNPMPARWDMLLLPGLILQQAEMFPVIESFIWSHYSYQTLKNQLWYIASILHYYYHNTSLGKITGLQLIQKGGKIHLSLRDLFYNNFLSFLTDIQQRGIQVLFKGSLSKMNW